MKNIFIEGIQGAGKSTLQQEIFRKMPELRICREGDYSPVELAWCAWMTEEEYHMIWNRYGSLQKEIEENTVREGKYYVVTYTRILTDIPGFHKELERYEIYNGRRTCKELEDIIQSRYRRFSGTGYLFECSFLQNIVEDLILFHQFSDDEIVAFYRRLYDAIQKDHFLLLYLYSDEIEENIRIIKKERSDPQGHELWYDLMLEYLIHSPYGRKRGWKGFDDLIVHLQHRQQVELRILNEVVGDRAVILQAKRWRIEEVIDLIQ